MHLLLIFHVSMYSLITYHYSKYNLAIIMLSLSLHLICTTRVLYINLNMYLYITLRSQTLHFPANYDNILSC